MFIITQMLTIVQLRWLHIYILSPCFPSPLAFHLTSLLLDLWDPAKTDDTTLEIHDLSRVLRFLLSISFCFPSPHYNYGSMGPSKKEKNFLRGGIQTANIPIPSLLC